MHDWCNDISGGLLNVLDESVVVCFWLYQYVKKSSYVDYTYRAVQWPLYISNDIGSACILCCSCPKVGVTTSISCMLSHFLRMIKTLATYWISLWHWARSVVYQIWMWFKDILYIFAKSETRLWGDIERSFSNLCPWMVNILVSCADIQNDDQTCYSYYFTSTNETTLVNIGNYNMIKLFDGEWHHFSTAVGLIRFYAQFQVIQVSCVTKAGALHHTINGLLISKSPA